MRSTLLAIGMFLAAVSLSAQETRYRLERILVEGARVDDDIVRAEARLPEERMYTDADFRQAVYRVRRLPFVVDATYRVEPGVTAGGTTLIIRIVDETMVFAKVDLSGTRVSASGESGEDANLRDGTAFLGGRFFLHNLGILETGLQGSDEQDGLDFGLAYRAYDILGTGGFANVTLAQRIRSRERDYAPAMVVGLGYPITQRQTVTLHASRTESSVDRELDVFGDDDDDEEDDTDQDDNLTLTDTDGLDFASLRWWYESIDDPFFATRGLSLSAGPYWAAGKATRESYNPTTRRIDSVVLESVAYGLALDASVYQRLFPRGVGFLRLTGEGSREEEREVENRNGAARAGLAFDFHSQAEGVLRPLKARLEIGAGYRTSERTLDTGAELTDNDTFAEAAFVLRHRWGTVRLSGIYLTEEE